eukprot:391124_1
MGDINCTATAPVAGGSPVAPIVEESGAVSCAKKPKHDSAVKPCKHRTTGDYCQLTSTPKCCACSDKRRRFNPKKASAADAADAAVEAATSRAPRYHEYCRGCVDHFSEIDAQISAK